VLRWTGQAGDPTALAPMWDPAPPTVSVEPHPVYGYACRIVTRV